MPFGTGKKTPTNQHKNNNNKEAWKIGDIFKGIQIN